MTKPFSVRELLARIKAILRRSQGGTTAQEEAKIMIGRLQIDFTAFQTEQDGMPVKLSHKEIEILAYLYKNKNKVVSRYDLLENVWGYGEQITTRTVDNFIVRIRQKVEANPNMPAVILTVHGSGYKLVL
jgi:DNA-binding response OmpR family regulator